METFIGIVLVYLGVGAYIGLMRHYKLNETWVDATKTAALWPRHIPNMWKETA